jgi:hypothetical protein
VIALFWRYWAWRSLRLAEYHRDAAWECGPDPLDDMECRRHLRLRNLHFARYDRACAALVYYKNC